MLTGEIGFAGNGGRSFDGSEDADAREIEVPEADLFQRKVARPGGDEEFLAQIARGIQKNRPPLKFGAGFRVAKQDG